MSTFKRVLVLGGGVAGLTAAHELAARGYTVTLFEADPFLVGGLARSQYCALPDPSPDNQELASSSVSFADATAEVGGARAFLPGEHGYRFFPAFYRHLTDTMQRTPLVDATGALLPGRRTVADHLHPTRRVAYASGAKGLPPVIRLREIDRADATLEGIVALVREMTDTVSFSARDVELLQLALVKFATSSDARRAQAEAQSWWDYSNAADLSPAAQAWLDGAPEALVAMSARQCDARTYAVASLQMMLDQTGEGALLDRTLAGPTSEAWLEPWRQFLEKRLGVRFEMNTKVVKLDVDGGGKLSHVTIAANVETEVSPSKLIWDFGDDFDYVVCALPLEKTRDVLPPTLNSLKGLPGNEDLLAFDAFELRSRASATSEPDPPASGVHGFGRQAGIQFYLGERLHLLAGHVYAINSAWGLSAVAQSQFWREDVTTLYPGLGTVLSVDIGVWDREGEFVTLTTANDAPSPEAIATEVWAQLSAAIGVNAPPFDATAKVSTPRGALPDVPWAWHLDEGVFGDDGVKGGNILINRPGDYALRPGRLGTERGYALTLGGRLVFAGPHMKTFTRLTTMEAANESARHAVNGILADALYKGEGCAIFPPERWELGETAGLKSLDEKLLAAGLDHAVEVLHAREAIKRFF